MILTFNEVVHVSRTRKSLLTDLCEIRNYDLFMIYASHGTYLQHETWHLIASQTLCIFLYLFTENHKTLVEIKTN